MATILDGKGTLALAVFNKDESLKKHEFGRPAPGPNDVHIDIHYVGMCHSDIHACDGGWGINKWPMAPGHEIAGVVRAVGGDVSEYKVGDRVSVGCMVGSCGECDLCADGLEQHCEKMVQTYSTDWPAGHLGHEEIKGNYTNGGYSTDIVVHKKFVFAVPEKMDLKHVGPLLCAGITLYSPLNRHVKGKNGAKVGIVGFGGLGHMGVKLAVAMGAEVTVYSRSTKKKEAAERLGAKLVSHQDEDELKKLTRTQDVIIDTVSAEHDISKIITNLKVGSTYVLIGGIPEPYKLSPMALIFSRYALEGSLIGGVPETAEMLEFCAEHDITPDIDLIHARDAAAAFTKIQQGASDARRNVIDISTLKEL